DADEERGSVEDDGLTEAVGGRGALGAELGGGLPAGRGAAVDVHEARPRAVVRLADEQFVLAQGEGRAEAGQCGQGAAGHGLAADGCGERARDDERGGKAAEVLHGTTSSSKPMRYGVMGRVPMGYQPRWDRFHAH